MWPNFGRIFTERAEKGQISPKSIVSFTFPLKGPKHEIFEIEFFTQIRPVRIGDLGTGEKN
jgi:hypothetical protein